MRSVDSAGCYKFTLTSKIYPFLSIRAESKTQTLKTPSNAGPLSDDKVNNFFVLTAIARFAKFFLVMIDLSLDEKKVLKFLLLFVGTRYSIPQIQESITDLILSRVP